MRHLTLLAVAFFVFTSLFLSQAVHAEEKQSEKEKKEENISLSGLIYEMGPTFESLSNSKSGFVLWRGLNIQLENNNLIFTIWASDSKKEEDGKIETQIFGIGTDISVVTYGFQPKEKDKFVPSVKTALGAGGYIRVKHITTSEKIPGTVEAGPMKVEVTKDGEDKKVKIPSLDLDTAPYFQFLTLLSFKNLSYKQVAPRIHLKVKTFPKRWQQTLFIAGVGISVK